MASEYKISQIKSDSSGIYVLARFYETDISGSFIIVTEENKYEYPFNNIGDKIYSPTRTKYSPEVRYCFNSRTTENQIHSYLYEQASIYGTPINTQ